MIFTVRGLHVLNVLSGPFLDDNGRLAAPPMASLRELAWAAQQIESNDDHLRNHGFIFQNGGWVLSPAYEINPVPDAQGLHLNISDVDNQLDYELAMSVIDFFRLTFAQAKEVMEEVTSSVRKWREIAKSMNISRAEQERMAPAFNV